MSTVTPPLSLLRSARRIGFLFSGGSARCAFQIGVVETLYQEGIHPSVCLGVSAGAWNAAAVAVGNWRRLRHYWRFFCRMPYVDVGNIFRERTPFIWTRLHDRAFQRYIGREQILAPSTMPVYVALTRLRDKSSVILDLKVAPDPFSVLLASNYLPPFYRKPLPIDGEVYGDGGYTDNAPYEFMFEQAGCDAVVIMASKGESEGGLFKSADDYEHVIPPHYADRCVVIRPRHRMPVGFVERRWVKLAPVMHLGALRTREVLFDERHPETDARAAGRALSGYVADTRLWLKRMRARHAVRWSETE